MSDLTAPVQAVDAEVSLLGAAMSGYPEVGDLLAAVEPADFYTPHHEEIWHAIGLVHRAGTAPDPVSVRLALVDSGVRHDPVRLVEIAALCPLVANADFYAAEVLEAAGRRRIQRAAAELSQLAARPIELDTMREDARRIVDDATTSREVSAARSLAQVLDGVIDQAETGRGAVLGTGWPDLDRTIGGLGPGRLIVVGARPGVGKSLMLTNLALHMAGEHHHAVLLASLEMPEREVGQRLLAAHARVNLTSLADGLHDESAWERIASRRQELDDMPITIDDAPTQTVTHVRRAARDLQRTRDDLALICVDYLQLVQPEGGPRDATRAEKVGQVSRDLKLLARETGACVVAAAQVNRAAVQRSDQRPTMADLRESGAIEADADQVILLHQPDDEIPELDTVTDKNRHGPKGETRLQIHGHYARLASTAWSPSQPTRTDPKENR